MDQKLCIYVCQAYFPEVRQILTAGDYPDVNLVGYPYDCLTSPISAKKILRFSEECSDLSREVLIIGSSCLTGSGLEMKKNKNFRFFQLDHCAELLTSKELIEYFIEHRYYIISNGWLANFQNHLDTWGFDPAMAKAFFAESAEKLMFLDTGITADYQPDLQKVSDYMGLPWEMLPIGLSHCRRLIDTEVYRWRAEQQRNGLNEQIAHVSRKAADFSMVFERMLSLVDLTEVNEIVQDVFQVLNLLFAPENIIYQPGRDIGDGVVMVFNPEEPIDANDSAQQEFSIEARTEGKSLGTFQVIGLRFPEYIDQYKPLRKVIGGICGLAIANALKFQTIKQNEIKLMDLTEDLTLANANKDKFFSIIAHDLRSPFSAFLGFTEIMTDEQVELSPEEMRETAVIVRNSARNLFSQLENLLEWSKLQMKGATITPIVRNLKMAVRDEFNLLESAAKLKEVRLNNEVSDQTELTTDRNMLHSILRNLIVNALKFSQKGGKITVSARITETGLVEILVQDQGIGLTPDMVANLFSLHKQTNRKGTMGEPSTGLGLMICKEFVEKLGGSIWVASEVGKGTTFYFTVPTI